ncbi:MAG TPA: hypothetical protein VI894_03545 [Candidatus Nanoarchaeia archaeon]|nr:hypothetical protein [Candidatus Nanoarchaeia archaeon]
MTDWIVKRTESFLGFLKKHKKNSELLNQLEGKIKRLKENPYAVGGELAGNLKSYRSTRLI